MSNEESTRATTAPEDEIEQVLLGTKSQYEDRMMSAPPTEAVPVPDNTGRPMNAAEFFAEARRLGLKLPDAAELAAREHAPVARDLLDEEHVADCWRLAAGDWRKFARDIERRAIHAARGVARDLDVEAELRKLLAYRVGGALLYTDGGELQDASKHPWIDFKRDSVESIAANLRKRAETEVIASSDADRFQWLVDNPTWGKRGRLKKGVWKWQMTDEGEPWGEWGDYRKVLDAARKAHPSKSSGSGDKANSAPPEIVVLRARQVGRTHALAQQIIDAMTDEAKARTSYGNIRDVLDAVHKINRAPSAGSAGTATAESAPASAAPREIPPHLLEFVREIANEYTYYDPQESVCCMGCGADLDDNQPHQSDCITLRAKALLAPSNSPVGAKEQEK